MSASRGGGRPPGRAPWWRRSGGWTLARRVVGLGFLALLLWGVRSDAGWLKGSTSATRLLDLVPFLDPLAGLEVALASRHVTQTVLVGAGILVGIGVLLGPVFCGWLCPLGLVLDLGQEMRAWGRRLAGRGRRRRAPHAVSPSVRVVVLGLFLGLALVLELPLFQTLSPINLFVRALLFGAKAGLLVVLALLVLELFFPRVWCRSLCPLGAFYAFIGRISPFRIRIDPALAGKTPCQQCTLHCPMGIRVMEDYSLAGKSSVDDPSCTRCGSCLDACPRSVLGFGFSRVTGTPSNPDENSGEGRTCDRSETDEA